MEYVFTFQGTQEAIFSEEVLNMENIKVRVMALPSEIQAGCGICIRVYPDDLEKSKKTLKKNKINHSGVYSFERIDGKSVYNKCN